MPERYVLNVGSIEERKNALLAVEAMLRVPNPSIWSLSGNARLTTEKVEHFIEENRLQGRVHLLHNVAFRHLRHSTNKRKCLFTRPVSKDSAFPSWKRSTPRFPS